MGDLKATRAAFEKWIGVEAEPKVWDVEKGHIRRFSEAIGDPNPLWRNEAYAKKTRYSGIIAPPLFLVDAGLVDHVDRLLEIDCPLKANINGGTELEFFKPMKVGDTITTVAKLADMKVKEGKSGTLIFLMFEVTYTNQRGELAVRCRNTFIRR